MNLHKRYRKYLSKKETDRINNLTKFFMTRLLRLEKQIETCVLLLENNESRIKSIEKRNDSVDKLESDFIRGRHGKGN